MNYFGALSFPFQLFTLTGAFLLFRCRRSLFTGLTVAGAALAAVRLPLTSSAMFVSKVREVESVVRSPWLDLVAAGMVAVGLLGYARSEWRVRAAAMDEKQSAVLNARRFLGLPRSALGWWSVWVAVGFFVFMSLFWQQAGRPGRDRSTFFSDPVNAACLIGAAASALAGMLLAVVAIVWKRERSWTFIPVVLSGLNALIWTLAALCGGNP